MVGDSRKRAHAVREISWGAGPLRNRRKAAVYLLQLTVFAASSIVEFNPPQAFFALRLTFDAVSNTGHCAATRCRNFNPAFLAMRQAFAVRQAAFGQLDHRFHGGIYLLLHRLIAGPTDSHDSLLLFKL